MSAIAESLRRQRLPLLTIALLVALGMVAWTFTSRTTTSSVTAPAAPVAAPAIEQAEWKIDYSTARSGKLTKAQQQRYAEQRVKAATLVRSLYDGIFLEPARVEEIVKQSFTSDGARTFRPDRLGFPSGARDVTTVTRKADIALDATTTRAAIARVAIVAEATLGDRTEDIDHRSTLWMERGENGWRVIAFDVKQGPAK